MANAQRGERSLAVNGEDYTLRLDFEAIARIESELGEGIVEIIRTRLNTGKFGLTDMAVIVTEMIRSGGEDGITLSRTGELVLEAGLAETAGLMRQVFTDTFGGHEGNGKASPRRKRKPSRGGA